MEVVGAETSLTRFLAGLDQTALARLLAVRPDSLVASEPRTIDELAERLGSAESLATALRTLPMPCVQLVETVVALGGLALQAELTDFLAGSGPDHSILVQRWLDLLTEHGILWPAADGRIVGPETLVQLFPTPLGLGPPLSMLVAARSVDGLSRILRTLGVADIPTRRADVVDLLLGVLTDADIVRGIADTAPNAVRQELHSWAVENAPDVDAPAFDGSDFDFDDAADMAAWSYDPVADQRRAAAANWALERGLVFTHTWSYGWQMPAEVHRALRGPDFRAPFAPMPPAVAVVTVDSAHLAAHSAGAVSTFADQSVAVVDRLARTPILALKSGGVGTRELAKLGKAVGCSEGDARLILDLCAATGLIDNLNGPWGLGDDAAGWRSLPPADRIGGLLEAWFQLSHAPTESRDETGKSIPALAARPCVGCLLARHNLLEALAELPEGSSVAANELAERALWRRPFVHVLAQDVPVPFASIRAEATALGVVADGALTSLGRALIAGDSATVRTLLVAALPESNDKALFGADLTVVVAGAPTADVSRLLDAAADREGRGGATVWRFTPGSIRRALDEGHRADALEESLAAIAIGELPQPLRYLIGDIGRQHGNLKVSAAVSIVRSEDEALLEQLSVDRSLRSLGLRQIGPTVVTADADADAVLTALRRAGYLPVPEGAVAETAPAQTERTLSRAAAAAWLSANRPIPMDPGELARRLVTRPAGAPVHFSATEQTLATVNKSLSVSEIRMLAHAVDEHGSVTIDYQSNSGNVTRRVITAPDLTGDSLLAWCQLRGDERWFRVSRVLAVLPAG